LNIQSEDFSRDLRAVWQDVEQSTLKIFEEARQYKEEKERQYKRWTWATYVLYTLGWTLGLVGSLYGVSCEGRPE
jgi:putative salt-induced outer membrane protein YdiY